MLKNMQNYNIKIGARSVGESPCTILYCIYTHYKYYYVILYPQSVYKSVSFLKTI